MVAFVNDKMTIVRQQVGYFAVPHEALDQRDINDTRRLAAPAADDAYILRIDIEKCPEAFHPLAEQLSTMDEDKRVPAPLSDERSSHNRLAERGGRREHAIVMQRQGVECLDLRAVQRSLELDPARKRVADRSLIVQLNLGALTADQIDSFVKTPSWQSHMTRMEFGARDDPWLAKGREPHGLRTIELGVLKGRQAYKPRRHRRRQIGPVDIQLAGDDDRDLSRKWYAERAGLRTSRRRHAPRFVRILVLDRHANAEDTAPHLGIANDFRRGIGR